MSYRTQRHEEPQVQASQILRQHWISFASMKHVNYTPRMPDPWTYLKGQGLGILCVSIIHRLNILQNRVFAQNRIGVETFLSLSLSFSLFPPASFHRFSLFILSCFLRQECHCKAWTGLEFTCVRQAALEFIAILQFLPPGCYDYRCMPYPSWGRCSLICI